VTDANPFAASWFPAAAREMPRDGLIDLARQERAFGHDTIIAKGLRIATEMQLVEVEKVSDETEHKLWPRHIPEPGGGAAANE
jgi:hypothetical protein